MTSITVSVDRRVGSKNLEAPLRSLLQGRHKVVLSEMRYGDVAWTADGPGGVPWEIAVERKTVPDLLSSLSGRRFVEHQLPGLINNYNYVYLLVEGLWRAHTEYERGVGVKAVKLGGKTGKLEYSGGAVTYRGWQPRVEWRTTGWDYENVCGMLASFRKAGIIVVRTASVEETLWFLRTEVNWWSKGYDGHKSAEAWAGTDVFGAQVRSARTPSPAEEYAARLPGVGQNRAADVAEFFNTARAVAAAKRDDWEGFRPQGLTDTGRKHPKLSNATLDAIQEWLDKPHKKKRAA